MPHVYSRAKGFTLIELIVVFTVLAILSTMGIASFVNYTNSQKLRNSTLDIKTFLQQARSQSANQVKPSSCTGFQGYEVRICCVPSGSNCPICLSADNYELDVVCTNNPNGILIDSSTLPSVVTVDDAGTTQRSYRFIPITGGVLKGGSILLKGTNNDQTTISVSGAGVIQ